jgi:hypothetical protein
VTAGALGGLVLVFGGSVTWLNYRLRKVIREQVDSRIESYGKKAIDDAIAKKFSDEIDPVLACYIEPSERGKAEEERDLSQGEKQVLKGLLDGKYPLRTVSGLAQEAAGFDDQRVSDMLGSLGEQGLAVEVEGKKGPRWILTSRGKQRALREC